MTDRHIEAARLAASAEHMADSPDFRSVPHYLSGILHALIAIAERMPVPTPATEILTSADARVADAYRDGAARP